MADDFIEVIAAEVEADPTNLALREDFIALLLEQDATRAAAEVDAFEELGGDATRVRVLRARVAAARLRSGTHATPQETTSPGTASTASSTAGHDLDADEDDDEDDEDDDDGDSAASQSHEPSVQVKVNSAWRPERPTVTLADVAGLADVKKHLNTTFFMPLRNPEMAAAFGQTPGGSLLMYGPPGCGKTFLARAIAGDLGASFIHATLADLLDVWVGSSERAIQSLFRDARAASPCVIFVDEFDALGGRRSSGGSGAQSLRMMVTQLLEELDGVSSANEGIYFLAATNRPWDIDPALRRPGRIDKTVLVLPPDQEARRAILANQLDGKPTLDVNLDQVAAATDGFSGADMAQVVKAALQEAMTASMETGAMVPVTTDALLAIAAQVTPSTASWFDQVAPVLEYGVDDGTFDQLRAYRVEHGLR